MPLIDKLRALPLNIFQSLSLMGLLVSGIAQVIMALMDKHVERFWAVYVVWGAVLVLGTLIGGTGGGHDHPHDH